MKSKTWFFVLIYFLIAISAFSQISETEIFSIQTKGILIFPSETNYYTYKTSPGAAFSAHFDLGKIIGLYLDVNALFLSRERRSGMFNDPGTSETNIDVMGGIKFNIYKMKKEGSFYFKGGFGKSNRQSSENIIFDLGMGYKQIIKNNFFIYGEADGLLHLSLDVGGGHGQKGEGMIGLGVGVFLK